MPDAHMIKERYMPFDNMHYFAMPLILCEPLSNESKIRFHLTSIAHPVPHAAHTSHFATPSIGRDLHFSLCLTLTYFGPWRLIYRRFDA